VDGFYLPWLREADCEAILVRPDFYIFGTAAKAADLPDLLADLSAKLDLVLNLLLLLAVPRIPERLHHFLQTLGEIVYHDSTAASCGIP